MSSLEGDGRRALFPSDQRAVQPHQASNNLVVVPADTMNPVARLEFRAKVRQISAFELAGLISLVLTIVAGVFLLLGLAAVESFRQQNGDLVGKRK